MRFYLEANLVFFFPKMSRKKITSNFAATNVIPGWFVASANVCFLTARPATVTVSSLKNPLKAPEPY